MPINYELKKYKYISIGTGVTSLIGVVFHEYCKIKRRLNSIVATNVFDIDQKRPDYIYIKYHIYRESMKNIKIKEQDKHWVNVIIYPFGKWWKTLKHSVAWRLLEIAKTGDQHDRIKAVRQLALIDHLKDWDYQHLAQICDSRTAISLARHLCDTRWFLLPYAHGAVRYPKSLICDLREQFDRLTPLKCINYFYKTSFNNFSILKGYTYETNYVPIKASTVSKQELDCIKQCLDLLFHVTRDPIIIRTLITGGTLQILMELQKLLQNNIEMKFLISKVIANMSVCKDMGNDFFVTGWVGVLAKWTKNSDMRVQVIAAKSLANLDVDDPFGNEYQSSIYPLYPRTRIKHKSDLDIIFIHGLLGGVFITWRQKDRQESELGLYEIDARVAEKNEQELIATLETASELNEEWEVVFPDCPQAGNYISEGPFSISGIEWINDDNNEEYTYCWPMDWLPVDYPNIRIIGLNYETSLSEWAASNSSCCPCENKNSLHDRAEQFLNSLTASGVGKKRPIIWVGHSMGGLVAKSIIVQALKSENPDVRAVGESTRGIFFLGTPHQGTSIAKLKHHVQVLLSPSIEVKELCEHSSLLLNLHEQFLNSLKLFKTSINIVSIAEGNPTMLTIFKFPFHIVTAESAKLKFGDFYLLNTDHLGLSKPIYRQSFLYQRLLRIINDVMNDVCYDIHSDNNKIIDNILYNNKNEENADQNNKRLLTKIWILILKLFHL